ncbi:MAG: hypothetical protein K8I82_10960, partial [Anaerolineae bacterium]|nr:hypothetical protein [Anaerolineae bacterium]
MKRLFLVVLVSLLLAACNGDDEETSQPIQNTAQPTVTLTPAGPTNTPIKVSTLPPEATLAVQVITSAPTRTPPPSITPRPSATSDLMIPITPASETPVATDQGPAFTIAYIDLAEQLNLQALPQFGDAVVPGTYDVFFEDGTVYLTFRIVSADTGEEAGIRAGLIFTHEEGRMMVNLVNPVYAQDTTEAYVNRVLDAVNDILQEALDDSIVEGVGGQFEEGFIVLTFTPTEDGFVVETLA